MANCKKHQQNHLLAAAESVEVIPPSIAGELHVKPMFGVVESFYLVRVTHTFVERLKSLEVFLLGRLWVLIHLTRIAKLVRMRRGSVVWPNPPC